MKKKSSGFYLKEERENKLNFLLKNLNISFNDINLLNNALCHSSYSNEFDNGIENNERLEFLGDSVLNLIITDYLYSSYPDKSEGDLSKARSYIVSEDSLSGVSRDLNLGEYILLSKGEYISLGHEKKGILADAFEALIGAFYLDSGFSEVKKFVTNVFHVHIDTVLSNGDFKDYKSLLQEYVQKIYKSPPVYLLDREEGPDHNKVFYVNLYIDNSFISNGSGKSKKEAEMKSAEIAFKNLTK